MEDQIIQKSNTINGTGSPQNSDTDAGVSTESNHSQSENFKDRRKKCFFIALLAFGLCLVTIGIIVACVVQFIAKRNPDAINCDEKVCTLGTSIVTGVSGVVGALSGASCARKYHTSCGVVSLGL